MVFSYLTGKKTTTMYCNVDKESDANVTVYERERQLEIQRLCPSMVSTMFLKSLTLL